MGLQQEPSSRLRKENALTTAVGVFRSKTSFEPRLCPSQTPSKSSLSNLFVFPSPWTHGCACARTRSPNGKTTMLHRRPRLRFIWSSTIQTHLILGQQHCCSPNHPVCVKNILPTTENFLRKLYKYSKKNYKSTEDKHETNHINNKYNDTNMNTRKMHNT